MSTKPSLLLVDDEERILRSLAILFRAQYRLLTTTDAREALAMVSAQTVNVIVSDQRMPIMRGVDLLRQVKERSPNTMRILLTGYSELESIVASVNEGEIFRFVNKPWDAQELRDTVGQASAISQDLYAAASAMQPPVISLGDTIPPMAPTPGADILVIDDDAEVVRTIREMVGDSQSVHWARSTDEALVVIQRHPVGVVVSELILNGENITTLLKVLKAEHPEIVSIVLTPFQDTSVLIGLINQGQVYRFLPKPVRRGPLGMNIASALRHHSVLKSAPKLRAAHAVEKLRQPDELSLASRVMGVLSRMRARPG